jgi:hypothetical protein
MKMEPVIFVSSPFSFSFWLMITFLDNDLTFLLYCCILSDLTHFTNSSMLLALSIMYLNPLTTSFQIMNFLIPGWREQHNKGIHNLYYLPGKMGIIK